MLSKEELIELSKLTIKDVDKSTLKELTEININPDDPIEVRFNSFIEQIGNPYHFLIDGTHVQIAFTNNGKTLEDCLFDYFIHRKNQDA